MIYDHILLILRAESTCWSGSGPAMTADGQRFDGAYMCEAADANSADKESAAAQAVTLYIYVFVATSAAAARSNLNVTARAAAVPHLVR